jgi:hypothetical protein
MLSPGAGDGRCNATFTAAAWRPSVRPRAWARLDVGHILHRRAVPVRLAELALASALVSMTQPSSVTAVRSRACRLLTATASMVVTCAVMLCTAGCGAGPTKSQAVERYGQELRDTVSTAVTDEQRRAQLLRIVDQMQAVQLRFSHETTEFIDSYRKLNADYQSTRPMFDQLFSDYSGKRVKARDEALDLHFQLAALATPAEWDGIGKAEAKLYKKVTAAQALKDQST